MDTQEEGFINPSFVLCSCSRIPSVLTSKQSASVRFKNNFLCRLSVNANCLNFYRCVSLNFVNQIYVRACNFCMCSHVTALPRTTGHRSILASGNPQKVSPFTAVNEPTSNLLLEKLIKAQTANRFITVFTTASHRTTSSRLYLHCVF